MKKIFMFLFFSVAFLTLVSCGKAAKPIPYPDSGYPHTYPYDK